MSESVERVRQRVENKELPHVVIEGRVMIPALPLRDFYYDHLLKVKKSNPSPKTVHTANASSVSNTQKVSSKAPGEKSGFKEDEWLPSAFHAARMADMNATKIYELGRWLRLAPNPALMPASNSSPPAQSAPLARRLSAERGT
jgi:hypothetical protein